VPATKNHNNLIHARRLAVRLSSSSQPTKRDRQVGPFACGLLIALSLNGCASPNLLFNKKSTSPVSVTAPTVADLVDHMACEIGKAYHDNTHLTTNEKSASVDPKEIARVTASNAAHLAHNNRWKKLVEGNFVASIDLNLMVTRAEGFNPSLSYIWPLTGAGHTPSPIVRGGCAC
jgi:hypothetical protein